MGVLKETKLLLTQQIISKMTPRLLKNPDKNIKYDHFQSSIYQTHSVQDDAEETGLMENLKVESSKKKITSMNMDMMKTKMKSANLAN
jgi:hypothetical protein